MRELLTLRRQMSAVTLGGTLICRSPYLQRFHSVREYLL